MYIFNSTAGWQEGRPVVDGVMRSKPIYSSSSSSTKASMIVTGLSSATKSFRHSGNNVTACGLRLL